MGAPLCTGSGMPVLVTAKSATRAQLAALPSSCLYSAKLSSVLVTRVEKLIALPPHDVPTNNPSRVRCATSVTAAKEHDRTFFRSETGFRTRKVRQVETEGTGKTVIEYRIRGYLAVVGGRSAIVAKTDCRHQNCQLDVIGAAGYVVI